MKEDIKQKDELAKKVTDFCFTFIENWNKFAKQRLAQIRDMERVYYNDIKPTVSGRSNIPVPVLPKYVDELKGRLDDSPNIKLESYKMSQKLVKDKIEGAFGILRKPSRGDWSRNDRMQRIMAIFSGYGVTNWIGENNEGTLNIFNECVDHNDFIFEPMGGSNLENHIAVGRFPIFKTREQIKSNTNYDKKQIEKLLVISRGDEFKRKDNFISSRFERYKSLGLDFDAGSYMGQDVFTLCEMQVSYQGTRYLLTFDFLTRTWIRFEPLKKVFGFDHYSYVLWQTHEDPNTVMCKSIVDDIYPLSETLRVKVNQLIDSSTKRVWGQRAFDPNFFPYPEELLWNRPDQLVTARSYNGKAISQGVYEFKNEDVTSSSIAFFEWIDKFLAGVTGIDPSAVSEEKEKVGVMFGQLGKAGARLGIYNKSYKEAWEKGGVIALHILKKIMTEPLMVKMLGTRGYEWDKFSKEELKNPDDFEIIAEGALVELEMNEAKKTRQGKAIAEIIKSPILMKEVNPRFLVEELLKSSEFSADGIKRAMDVKNYGNEEVLAHADEACDEIITGKIPKLYQGADVAFMEYIKKKAEGLDDDDPKRKTLFDYGMAHKDIVIKNMANNAMEKIAQNTPPQDAKASGGAKKMSKKPLPIATAPAVNTGIPNENYGK